MKGIKAVAFGTIVVLASLHFRTAAFSRTLEAPARPASSTAPDAAEQTLPLKRVILYSNGVAYFERRGTVTGRAVVNLKFKQSQIDDVLKSVVVLDLGKGRIGSVSYNSSAPPSARLGEIPFSVEAGTTANSPTGGLAGVLRQLQGAKVAVTSGTRTVAGSILTVERRESRLEDDKPAVTDHFLVIASDDGELTNFNLTEVKSVRLLDEGAKYDVKEFADATASARRRDAKTISVTSDGEGSRELVVSYTVAAPIWKTNYRVVFDTAGKPFFQGWAIVDNVGEEDWNDVSLSLVSGSPISFIQPIQQPLYRYRPVVPVPTDLNLSPQIYQPDGTSGPSGLPMSTVTLPNPVTVTGGANAAEFGRNAMQPRSNNQRITDSDRNDNVQTAGRPFITPATTPTAPTTELSTVIASADSGVATAASGAEIGDLFEYRIEQPVTVKRDRSALIPILQAKLEGERTSIYNEATFKDRPMSGMRLQNTSNLTLEAGTLTVIDNDAYAGEGRIERFKPGERRFFSFALDLGTLVSVKTVEDSEPAFLIRAGKGVLEAHYYQFSKKIYTLTNQTDRPKLVYVEHPVREGWVLSDDTMQPTSKGPTVNRFRVEIEPRKTVELPITERRALMSRYQISDLVRQDLEFFVSRKYLDDATKAVLEKIIELKQQVAAIDARVEQNDKERESITEDQGRLRENIEALKSTPQAGTLIARYVAKADQQETRLEQIDKDDKKLQADRDRLTEEIFKAAQALTLERKPSGN